MPKYYCEYCDINLTHSSPAGRRQHNTGRRHINIKIEYFQNLIRDPTFVVPSHVAATALQTPPMFVPGMPPMGMPGMGMMYGGPPMGFIPQGQFPMNHPMGGPMGRHMPHHMGIGAQGNMGRMPNMGGPRFVPNQNRLVNIPQAPNMPFTPS